MCWRVSGIQTAKYRGFDSTSTCRVDFLLLPRLSLSVCVCVEGLHGVSKYRLGAEGSYLGDLGTASWVGLAWG